MSSDPRLTCLIMLALSSVVGGVAICKPDPFARSIQIDPQFAYYRDRSPDSIASEVRANGFGAVRLIYVCESAIDPALVKAFHNAGLAVWLTTFGNGTYSTADFPPGWEKWKMKLMSSDTSPAAGFTYLCLNDPGYREWKKKRIVDALKRAPFDGVEMAEPFWPAYMGPENKSYGCLCEDCRDAFLKMYPDEKTIPDFSDESSPDYYKTNKELYEKWIDFRAKSVVAFHGYIYNTPGGVRDVHPRVKIATWGIADDVPNPVETLIEWEGIDGAMLAAAIRPDMYVIQTDWPDWTRPDLSPDYPLKYKPFVDAIHSTMPKLPVIMQADNGSWENCRRDWGWLRRCESAARKAGMVGVTAYEYHLALDIYEAEPAPVRTYAYDSTIRIAFNKRLDARTATDLANYTVDTGKVLSASCDGNLVFLKVEGRPTRVSVRNISDDPARRFFKNHPPVTMKSERTVAVRWENDG